MLQGLLLAFSRIVDHGSAASKAVICLVSSVRSSSLDLGSLRMSRIRLAGKLEHCARQLADLAMPLLRISSSEGSGPMSAALLDTVELDTEALDTVVKVATAAQHALHSRADMEQATEQGPGSPRDARQASAMPPSFACPGTRCWVQKNKRT